MDINVSFTPETSRPTAFAASELKRYLSRMLPYTGTIDISLTDSKTGDRVLESYDVDISPDGGTIRANRGRGVLLAVYDVLRRLGCRFPSPGAADEVVPRIDRASLDLHYSHTARFRHRGVCIEGADSRENVLDFIDWLPKVGFNTYFSQFKIPYIFYSRWYEHRLNPTLPPEPFTMEDAVRLMEESEAELSRRGILLHKVGHGWTGAVLGYDSVAWDRDEPLSPELRPLAAEINGARDLYLGIAADTNLCLSNPEAVRRFVDLVADYAGECPDVDYLHIWLADEFNNVCECPECRKTTPSDQYVELLNAIDARLTELGLETRLVFLLYQELLWPPIRARLRNPDRFLLMFAPISRTFGRPYETEDDGSPLPEYVRNRVTLPVDVRENVRFLRGWQKIFSQDSFVYDYPLGRAHYGDFGYMHIARVIYEDISRLRRLGLNGYISCQELRAGSPNFLPNYVMGLALFDGRNTIDALTEEYFTALYGSRAKEIGGLLGALSENELCDYLNGKGPREDAAAAEKLERIAGICENAPSDLPETLDFHLSCVRRLARAMLANARGEAEESRREYDAFLDYIRSRELQSQRQLDTYRIIEVTTKYTGLSPKDRKL